MNQDASEAEIVDNYRLDHLYTHAFKDGSGKYFTVVSRDEAGAVVTVDAEDPRPQRNKIKTTPTFVPAFPADTSRPSSSSGQILCAPRLRRTGRIGAGLDQRASHTTRRQT